MARSIIIKDQKLAQALYKMYERPDKELENRLLEGEVAIGHAKKVIRYNVHDDPTRGTTGTLVCTNFRLCLITPEKATYDLIELKNRLISDHDILLNNVETIYVEYPNKRKRLVPGSKIKDGIHRLELHCKDFRIAAFNFKLTAKGEEKNIIKAILHHAYPSTVNLLFAFDHKHGMDLNQVCSIPLYRNQPDWDMELQRCRVTKKTWRTAVLNRQFTALETMGSYVVVPASINDSELAKAADQFYGNRIPCWCWTDSNGCTLVRASSLRPETEHQHFEDDLYEAIRKTDPEKRPFKIIDVSKQCPSCHQLQQSFNKLKSLCMPASESDFWESDAHWHQSLHSTKWLQHVSTTLSTARQAAMWLREKEHNVVVKETSGVDFSSVITSLIQLILDPTCRTIDGFQALIQREWVVAGHPFLDRLGHLLQPKKTSKQPSVLSSAGENNQLAPVFLLFLDCVWQLYLQFPARFESNATFLTVLYDSTRMSAFDTFIFNNERQRDRSLAMKENPSTLQEMDHSSSWQFLPVWAWRMQYNTTDMTLFNNPLYKLRTMECYRQFVEETASVKSPHRTRLLSNEMFFSDDLHSDGTLNGDVPDCAAFTYSRGESFNEETKRSKKKMSMNEKRTEEHRRKLEMDNPLPLNKNKPKNSHVRNFSDEGGGRIEENKKVGAKSGVIQTAGHFPKVALMPKHGHSPKEELDPENRPSRSKSDGDLCEENSEDAKQDSLEDDEVPTELHEQSTNQAVESSSPKLKSRWSFRRKKKEVGATDSETSCEDVPSYTVRMQDKIEIVDEELSVGASSALYPSSIIPKLQLWRPCYLRWLPWSQIYGGGPASVLLQESMLYDELHSLQNKLQTLKQKLYGDSMVHHSGSLEEENSTMSGMYFNHSMSQENLTVLEPNKSKSESQTSLNFLSSYYPYSPIKGLRSRSTIGTPISNFLQGGSLFNFGRSRKHARSPSSLSITHSLTPSIEDISTESEDKASRSLEDLTSGTPPSVLSEIYRSQSDANQVRQRSKHLDPQIMKPQKLTPPPTPTENITYITSL